MDGRAWNSGYQVTIDGWQSFQWVNSIREVTRIFNEHGIQTLVSHSKVYTTSRRQAQRDDHEAKRPNTRAIRPLPEQAQFRAVEVRGERYLQLTIYSCKLRYPPGSMPSSTVRPVILVHRDCIIDLRSQTRNNPVPIPVFQNYTISILLPS